MRFAAVAVFLFAAVGVVAKHITLEAEVGDPRMIQTSALHETPGKSLEGVSNITILCPRTHQEILLTAFNSSGM